MRETHGTNECGRAGDLVGYLYGEATGRERADFEQHLSACAACRDDLAAFTQLRSSVGELRAGLFDAAPRLSLSNLIQTGANAATPLRAAPLTPASPLAALRAFFSLSPAWLRVASAAAALVVCALAALAVFNAELRFGDGGVAFATGAWARPAQPGAKRQTELAQPGQPAEQDALRARLNQLSSEHEAALRELEETRAQLEDSRAANLVDAVAYDEAGASADETGTNAVRADGPAATGPRRPAKSPNARGASTRRTRRTTGDEEDLPRLLDLLSTAN